MRWRRDSEYTLDDFNCTFLWSLRQNLGIGQPAWRSVFVLQILINGMTCILMIIS